MSIFAFTFIYVLSVYFWFYLWARSELLRKPREWVLAKVATRTKISYMLMCPFCLTAHFGVAVTLAWWAFSGFFAPSPVVLMVAPVLVLIVDLVVRELIRRNEPLDCEVLAVCHHEPSLLSAYQLDPTHPKHTTHD